MIRRFETSSLLRLTFGYFRRLVSGSIAGVLVCSLSSGPALAQTQVELRIPEEIAPPGGTALFFVEMTEPEPISGGQTTIRYARSTALASVMASPDGGFQSAPKNTGWIRNPPYDYGGGAPAPGWVELGGFQSARKSAGRIRNPPYKGPSGAAAAADPQNLFGGVSRVDVLSASDEVSGNVSISDGTISVQLAAKTGLFGTDRDLPLIAFAVPVSTTAVPGESFTVEIEVASLAGPGGVSYQVATRPGTFTVGGTAISDISPYRGSLAAGSVLTVRGAGFEAGAELKIDETKVESIQFVSSTELRVTLGSNLELRNTTRFRLRNPSGSSDLFYPINVSPAAIPSPGTIAFLSVSKPILADAIDVLEIQSDLPAAGALELEVSDPTVLSLEGGLSLPAGPHRQAIRVQGHKAGQVTVTARVNGVASVQTVAVKQGSVFQIPVLRNTADLRMGLGLTNRAGHPVNVRLRGFPRSGGATQAIEALVEMEPGQQIARFLDEITPQFADFSGWMEVSSPDPGLFALFIHVPGGMVRYPGAAAEARGRRQFVLTFPEPAGRYELVLANNNLASAEIDFTWFSSDGQSLISGTRTIESQGSLVEEIRSLLANPALALGGGYLSVRSSQDLTGFLEMTDLPLLFGGGLVDPIGPGGRLELPRVAAGGGWETYVDVVNLSDSSSTGSLRTRLQDGDLLPAKEIVLPPHGFARIRLSELSGVDSARLWAGSAQIEMSGQTAASVLLTGPSGSGLATSLPVYQSAGTEYVFGQVANGSIAGFQLFTGLGIANAGAEASQISVQVYDANGVMTGETAISLAAGASRVALLSELIPDLPVQFGGHVHISSSGPILAVEFFGDSSLSFLSAVPFRP